MTAATIAERFDTFHEAHPEVYGELVALTRRARAAGRQKVGVKAMWEVLRWERFLRGLEGEKPYKLNNNLVSRYARMLDADPEFAGMIDLRELRS